MRFALFVVLLLSVALLAAQVTIKAIDASTSKVLANSMIMLWKEGGKELVAANSSGILTVKDLEPGLYIVEVIAFGRVFNQTVYIPSVNPIDIKIPTAFIIAVVVNDADGSSARWPVVVLGPDGRRLAPALQSR